MNRSLMRQLGMVLLGVGFLWGSFLIVRHRGIIEWTSYGVAFAITVVGVVLSQLSRRSSGEESAEVGRDMSTIKTSLRALVDKITAMNAAREEIGVLAFCDRIDADCIDAINDFVEARESMIQRHGLASYAKLMDNFALAERALNRAWCASADGYIDELYACLDRAQASMGAALMIVDGLASAPAVEAAAPPPQEAAVPPPQEAVAPPPDDAAATVEDDEAPPADDDGGGAPPADGSA